MAMAHLNVFHWHLVDDQSFPLELQAAPLLAERATWIDEKTGQKLTISANMVRRVVKFAYDRGIRVVPEIDFPSHAGGVKQAYPEMTGCPNEEGVLDVTHPEAIAFAQKIYDEVATMFPDNFFHIGGDEMRHCLGGNSRGGYNDEIHQAIDTLARHNKTAVMWEDVFSNGAVRDNTRALIHGWKCWGSAACHGREGAMKAGFKFLQSTCFYFDADGSWWEYYGRNMFDTNCGISAVDMQNLVYGGEVCLWTEMMDFNNILCRAFPRAYAAAERFWSHEVGHNPPSDTREGMRLRNLSILLRIRGIQGHVLSNPEDRGYCSVLPGLLHTAFRNHNGFMHNHPDYKNRL